jgi:TldD protein
MQRIALDALEAATRRGISYADVRVVESRDRSLATKNGQPGHLSSSHTLGVGIRVLAQGCWGFASTDDLSPRGLQSAAALATEIARSGSAVKARDVTLAAEEPHQAVWSGPCVIDPFAISVDQQLALLLAIDSELRHQEGITLTETNLFFERRRQIFASSIGSLIDQTRTVTGAGFSAFAFRNDDIQKRSYPNSFGGQYQLGGYEIVEGLYLVENAPRIASEAVALHSADQCPEGEYNLILDGSQLALQIHESVGHPAELDRVLGSEANYAGMSFLTLDHLNHLRYGSEVVNVVADARPSHGPGLGTFAFDDEGVSAQSNDIIRDGLFTGYLTSRETAAAVGQSRSSGAMRADGWARTPIIRMTNVSLLPGEQSFEELLAGVPHAIYMETNKSWSIDDKRYHFQFGCEIAWEIRHGRRIRMLKNPIYSGITTEFWNSCEAIAGPQHWVLWGVPNCGKGQPEQVMGTGHGAAPARFRRIKIGGGYGG